MLLLFCLLLFSCPLMAMDYPFSYASITTSKAKQSHKKAKHPNRKAIQSDKKAAEHDMTDAEFARVLYEADHLINSRSGLYKREGRAPEPAASNQEEAMDHKKQKYNEDCNNSVLPTSFLDRLHQSYSRSDGSDIGLPQLEEAKDEKEYQPEAQQPPYSPKEIVYKRNRIETKESSDDCREPKRSRHITYSEGHKQMPDELLEVLSKLQISE